MAEHQIQPHRVTKPIQLLAAWLVGLVLVDAMFLATALRLEAGWERGCLVAFAIVNVPLFLSAIFVLQTRFRAELQEDTFYSDYLSKKTSSVIKVEASADAAERLEVIERQLLSLVQQRQADNDGELRWGGWRIALNEFHPQFSELRAAMRAQGIPLAEIFGAKGSPRASPPASWVVSINIAMPIHLKAELLRLVLPFKFDGFHLWTPIQEADETEDVYIGSYGSEKGGYVAITNELESLLAQGLEEGDLSAYERHHRVSISP